MLTVGGRAEIFLYKGAVDMRKSFEGLMELAQTLFEKELMSGSLFVFLNKRRDRMKVLYWDRDGFAIWYKALEKGHFSAKTINEEKLSRTQFLMLLEGVTPKRVQKRWTGS